VSEDIVGEAWHRETYSTGQIAKVCKVSVHTVVRWIDTEILHGYRVPGSKDRRVLHADLIDFLHSSGMISALGYHRGMLLAGTPELAPELHRRLPDYPVEVATDWYGAAERARARRWSVVVIDFSMGSVEASRMLAAVTDPRSRPVKVAAVLVPEGGVRPPNVPAAEYPLSGPKLERFADEIRAALRRSWGAS